MSGGTAYGCGQCLPCRIQKRRVWANRIMLESLCHKENSFLTLTYSDENLSLLCDVKTRNVHATLVPSHLVNFLKRLRTHLEPSIVRFFAVAEYGDQTFRPHYHVCLFNFKSCSYGRTRTKPGSNQVDPLNCCPSCKLIAEKWKLGDVQLGELNSATASYCAEYTTKKLTKPTDQRLEGRVPEFTRMSRRPGIGAPAMWDVASTLLRHNLEDKPDVPFALALGKRQVPLGRYLMQTLRHQVGKPKNAPQETFDLLQAKMLPLQLRARGSEKSLRQLVIEENAQNVLNLEAKALIYKQRKNL